MSWRMSGGSGYIDSQHDDLVCDGDYCRSTYTERGSRQLTELFARSKGWHCFQGRSVTGRLLTVHLCTSCAGNQSRPASDGVSKNQEPLF